VTYDDEYVAPLSSLQDSPHNMNPPQNWAPIPVKECLDQQNWIPIAMK